PGTQGDLRMAKAHPWAPSSPTLRADAERGGGSAAGAGGELSPPAISPRDRRCRPLPIVGATSWSHVLRNMHRTLLAVVALASSAGCARERAAASEPPREPAPLHPTAEPP